MTTSDLSGAALNHAIAERLGWRIEKAGARYIVTDPQGKQEAYQKKAWAEAYILRRAPDWANSVGDALALCKQLAREHPGSLWQWAIEIFEMDADRPITIVRFANHSQTYYSAGGETDALALARLALAALTQEAHE
jgi:hypothetical protein